MKEAELNKLKVGDTIHPTTGPISTYVYHNHYDGYVKIKDTVDGTIHTVTYDEVFVENNSNNKLENIEVTQNNRRIMFSFEGKEYSVNITNENELRLSTVDGSLLIRPTATNCLVFGSEE